MLVCLITFIKVNMLILSVLSLGEQLFVPILCSPADTIDIQVSSFVSSLLNLIVILKVRTLLLLFFKNHSSTTTVRQLITHHWC